MDLVFLFIWWQFKEWIGKRWGGGAQRAYLGKLQAKDREGPRSSGNGKKRMNVRGDTEI